MKYTFYYKNPDPDGVDGFIGYGEDAEVALKSLFGRITDELLDTILEWKQENSTTKYIDQRNTVN